MNALLGINRPRVKMFILPGGTLSLCQIWGRRSGRAFSGWSSCLSGHSIYSITCSRYANNIRLISAVI